MKAKVERKPSVGQCGHQAGHLQRTYIVQRVLLIDVDSGEVGLRHPVQREIDMTELRDLLKCLASRQTTDASSLRPPGQESCIQLSYLLSNHIEQLVCMRKLQHHEIHAPDPAQTALLPKHPIHVIATTSVPSTMLVPYFARAMRQVSSIFTSVDSPARLKIDAF
jgi:hypothetical protein